MALVNFKKGLLAKLPATKTAGTFYITTDERAMYLDVDADTRIRLGDFQEFATVDALTANANPNTTSLYYVSDINCLAKWNGSEYIQINRDTGMTSVEVTGDGNALTAAVYDAAGRKLTLTKGATYMTAADVDSKISDKVGTLTYNDTTYDTVKAYVDAKTSGIATDAALSDLTTRVTTAEGDIDTLQAAIGEGGSVTVAIADAKKAGTDAASAAAAAQATADTKTTMAEVEAKNYATKTEAQGYANAKDTAISAAKAAADAAQADVDALEAKVGTVPEDKTVVQMIADAQAAATYDDSAVKASIKAIADDYLKSADKTELSNAICSIDTAYKAADTALSNRVKAIEDDYLKAADKTELANSIADVKSDVDTFLAAADIGGEAIDTLKEIQNYISSDGTAAAEMTSKIGALETTVGKAAEGENPATGLVKSVADNAAAIATEKSRAEGVEADLAQADTDNLAAAKKYADDAITGLKIGDYAKKSDLDAHTGDTTVHITAEERTKWNTAEGKAHTHSNKALLDTYTQTEENLADAVAKKHSHANAAELNKIADGDVAKWNAAQANAEATAASALATAKTELEGKITAAQTAAEGKVTELANGAVKTNTDNITALQNGKADKATTLAGYGITDAYTKTETYTQAEVQELLTWGEFSS